MKKHNGFTLAETLVTLAVIGVIAAILFPSLANIRPNKNVTLLRKAYYITSRVVDELINDEELYPDDSDHPGFKNTVPKQYHGISYGGDDKFCNLFLARLNTRENATCNNGGTFETTDGIAWTVPATDFSGGRLDVSIDVNGEKGNNCAWNAENCSDPDQFTININSNGKIGVNDTTRNLLTSSNVSRSTREIIEKP